jgi:hypothetical protein
MPNCATPSLSLRSCSPNQFVCATYIGMRAGKLPIFSTVVCVSCSIVITKSSFTLWMFLFIGFEHWQEDTCLRIGSCRLPARLSCQETG